MKRISHILFFLFLAAMFSNKVMAQDTIVCDGDYGTAFVQSTYPHQSIFNWHVEGGTIEERFGDSIVVHWNKDVDEGLITVREISSVGNCEGPEREFIVEIRHAFADLGMNKEICEGESLALSPGANYEDYRWQDGSTQSSYMADSAGTYWVEVNDAYGCSDRDSVNLVVHDNPDVNIDIQTTYPDEVYLDEDSVAFAAGVVDLITLDAGMWSSYEWNTGEMTGRIEVEDTDVALATTGSESKDFWVTVSSAYGCDGSGTIAVTVFGGLKIPNAITPNGDNINDKWKIPGLSLYPNCVVQVFDRWGNTVYKSKGYDEADYWDGTDQNGKKLPMDSYYYVIKPGNGEESFHGSISIIR